MCHCRPQLPDLDVGGHAALSFATVAEILFETSLGVRPEQAAEELRNLESRRGRSASRLSPRPCSTTRSCCGPIPNTTLGCCHCRRSSASGCSAAIGRSGRPPGSISSTNGAPSSKRSRPTSMSCAIGISPPPKRPSATIPIGRPASSSAATGQAATTCWTWCECEARLTAPDWRAIRAPTLVASGAHDFLWPPEIGRQVDELIPNQVRDHGGRRTFPPSAGAEDPGPPGPRFSRPGGALLTASSASRSRRRARCI